MTKTKVYILYGYYKAFYSTWNNENSSERKFRLGVFSSKENATHHQNKLTNKYDYFNTVSQVLDNPPTDQHNP